MTRFNAKRSGYYRENMKGKLAAYQSLRRVSYLRLSSMSPIT